MTLQKNTLVVEAVGLSKIYKDFWGRKKAVGVDGINFNVKKGEVLGLLGPNGSGKSTTIKLILGLLRPEAGNLKVLDHNPSNILIKKRIGYLPEDTYLYKFLRADETLEFFGSLFNLSSLERKKRAQQLLEMVGLIHAAKRRVGEFSKGMMRRLVLAQALINDPDLVLLDEPTSGLDPIGCRDVKTIIRLLAKRNKTVIVCSHLLADMEEICDNVLIMHGGRILAEGSLKYLLKERNKTQITSPVLDQKTLQMVLSVIEKNLSSEAVTVNHPQISLEKFFLDVLKRAPKKGNHDISTPQSSKQIAGYLIGQMEDPKSSEKFLKEWTTGTKNASDKKVDQPSFRDKKKDFSPNLSILKDLETKKKKKIQLTLACSLTFLSSIKSYLLVCPLLSPKSFFLPTSDFSFQIYQFYPKWDQFLN